MDISYAAAFVCLTTAQRGLEIKEKNEGGDVRWIEGGVDKSKVTHLCVCGNVTLNTVYIPKMSRKNTINKRGNPMII